MIGKPRSSIPELEHDSYAHENETYATERIENDFKRIQFPAAEQKLLRVTIKSAVVRDSSKNPGYVAQERHIATNAVRYQSIYNLPLNTSTFLSLTIPNQKFLPSEGRVNCFLTSIGRLKNPSPTLRTSAI